MRDEVPEIGIDYLTLGTGRGGVQTLPYLSNILRGSTELGTAIFRDGATRGKQLMAHQRLFDTLGLVIVHYA